MSSSSSRSIYTLEDGTVLFNVHQDTKCLCVFCALHNPSDHPLRDAPRGWEDASRIVTRLCSHGEVHPDYDSLIYKLAQDNTVLYHHRCCVENCCGLPDWVVIGE